MTDTTQDDLVKRARSAWKSGNDFEAMGLIKSMADRIEELEVKLAAAVESLRVIEDASGFFARNRAASDTETLSYAHETTRRLCVTTLAELKGQDDE